MKKPVAFLSDKPKHKSQASQIKSKKTRLDQRVISKKPTLPVIEEDSKLKYLQIGASISLIALIFLSLAWETIIAPLKPQGSWLSLKAAFLCLPLLGILKGKRYTYQWASMFILFYFIEGCVRAWADVGISASLALAEVLLTTVFFFCTIYYAKFSTNLIHKSANI